MNDNQMTGTYSPEDNKLRLYAMTRLEKSLYEQVRAAGFIWAPKQELFVAPMWTPQREDLLLELCGEVGDEDTSLVDRAEQRAERFGDYSDSRADDADQAHKTVAAITNGIPLGQPILVGHHSERHARKNAARIESGMRRAVKMWETSQYWTDRAKSAIRAAKYKELPAVRARRIKKLEAEQRKQQREKAQAERALRFWRGESTLTNNETGEKRLLEITEANRELLCRVLGRSDLGHFGVCKNDHGSFWSAWDVLRPEDEQYKDCPLMSVAEVQAIALKHYPQVITHQDRWINHCENRLAYERTMLDDAGGIATDRVKPEQGGACVCWATNRGGYSYIVKVNRVSVTVLDNWGNSGANFTRVIPFDKLSGLMTAAQVQTARDCGNLIEFADKTGFCLIRGSGMDAVAQRAQATIDPKAAQFDAMRDTLKVGVQVVSAANLFPTPTALAKQLVEKADLMVGQRVLEPSAGTGQIVMQIIQQGIFRADCVAVEINPRLAEMLQTHTGIVCCADFLSCNGDLGKFDRIVMNPPFENGADIKHIKHALTFLNEGGRLVSLCAAGPRQQAELSSMGEWTDLGQAFKEVGTGVNVAMIIIDR